MPLLYENQDKFNVVFCAITFGKHFLQNCTGIIPNLPINVVGLLCVNTFAQTEHLGFFTMPPFWFSLVLRYNMHEFQMEEQCFHYHV